MSGIDQVSKLLAERFARPGECGRIVFWRDTAEDYADTVNTIIGENATNPTLQDVELIRPYSIIDGTAAYTPFTARYRMTKEKPDGKFLVYLTGPIPDAKDNWLLDMELAYGPVFSADRLTMIATELLPEASPDAKRAWLEVMQRTAKFFASDARISKLAARLTPQDDAQLFQAKMIAVLLNLKNGKHSLQDIWRKLLEQYADDDDSGIQMIDSMGLSDFHWQGTTQIYRYPEKRAEDTEPTPEQCVGDFVLWMFDLAWHGFEGKETGVTPYANIKRDFENWYNDRTFTNTFKELAERAVEDLSLRTDIVDMDIDELVTHDYFKEVDDTLVHKLYELISTHAVSNEKILNIIQQRKMCLWYDEYAKDYQAIAQASALHQQLEASGAIIDSINCAEDGFEKYCKQLYKVDAAYRRFITAWNQVSSERPAIAKDLERDYCSYQRALNQTWQKQIEKLPKWDVPNMFAQSNFYTNVVVPATKSGRKIAVIISDALRYEVAQEFTERLDAEQRFTVQCDARYSVLPSYTQLGMAALLPHSKLALDADHEHVLADGHSTRGTENRNQILSTVGGKAIQAEEFKALDRNARRELMKSCSVLYVYHNVIDSTGDKEGTEDETFNACERAITDLIKLVKDLANANVTNMVVTADHGFLYQNSNIGDIGWLSEQPQGDEVWVKKRRFSIGANLAQNNAFLTFTSQQLGLANDESEHVTVQIPNSILRIRKQGTGTRYVHGGASLQEIVVPVVHINKGRNASGDIRPVEFDVLQQTDRITSGQITVEFFQKEPVGGKHVERTVWIGLWGVKDGKPVLISNETPVTFNMTSEQPQDRHQRVTFVLTSEAEQFNGHNVELRLREDLAKSSQKKVLDQKAIYLLKRGIIADDGFDFD